MVHSKLEVSLQIEEIDSAKGKGPKFDYSRRGEEVRRLAQSMGAERQASAQASQMAVTQPAPQNSSNDDLLSISAEAIDGAASINGNNTSRSVRILNGLQESFQNGSQDRNNRNPDPSKPIKKDLRG